VVDIWGKQDVSGTLPQAFAGMTSNFLVHPQKQLVLYTIFMIVFWRLVFGSGRFRRSRPGFRLWPAQLPDSNCSLFQVPRRELSTLHACVDSPVLCGTVHPFIDTMPGKKRKAEKADESNAAAATSKTEGCPAQPAAAAAASKLDPYRFNTVRCFLFTSVGSAELAHWLLFQFGTLCHVEVPALDLPRVSKFFTDVFGWNFRPSGPEYSVFTSPGAWPCTCLWFRLPPLTHCFPLFAWIRHRHCGWIL
jgi:hypothetical protein